MARSNASKSTPCRGVTRDGRACGRATTNTNGLCGVCLGAPDANAQSLTGADIDRLRDIADTVASTPEPSISSLATKELFSTPTPELVRRLEQTTEYAVATQLSAVASTGAARAAAQSQADAARRDAAALEDAILTRHPDPYGAALATAAWENAAGEPMRPGGEIRAWLAENQDAETALILRGLNEIAASEGVDAPWVPTANRVAVARVAKYRNPQDPEVVRELESATTIWGKVAPAGAWR